VRREAGTTEVIMRSLSDNTKTCQRTRSRYVRGAGIFVLVLLGCLFGSAFVSAQHSTQSSASLSLQISPAAQVTTDGANAYVWIRLGSSGAGSLWGDNTNTCTSPIAGATAISSSGKFTYPLSSIPFAASNAYICVYDPGPPVSPASVPWPHTATSLAFVQQPTGTIAGSTITPAVTVKVLDGTGVLMTGSSASVTLAITSGTGASGATLGGTVTKSAVNGVATFGDLIISKAATGYQLTATSSNLTSTTSTQFNISSGSVNATSSTVNTNPASVVADGTTSSTVTVTLLDANTNPVSGKTVTLSQGSGNSTISAASGTSNSSGVVTFTVKDTKAETVTYTATDTTDSVVVAQTANVAFIPGALNHFAIAPISSPKTAGTPFTVSNITAQDVNNNTVTAFTSPVTYGGTAGVTGTSAAFTAGILTNASVTPSVAGTNLTFTVSDGSGHTGSATIATVNPGAAAKLVYTTVPSTGTAGTAFSVTVQSQDANGNPANPSSNTTIALSKATGGGTLSGTLTGSIPSTGNSVTISSVVYSKSDTMTLTATATAGQTTLTPVTSGNIVFSPGAASKLVFTTQPGGGTGGTAWSQQPVVALEDANNNILSGDNTDQINLSINTNPGGGALACTVNPANVAAGSASFAGCKIDKQGSGYVLKATSGSFSTTSSNFNVTIGPAAQLSFTTSPGGTIVAGSAFPTQPTVTIQDAGGNTVTSSTASITLSITSGTGATGAALACTANPKAASSGVDTFGGCNISVGSNASYTLTATATLGGNQASAASTPFLVGDFTVVVTTAISPNPTSRSSASATAVITVTSLGSFSGSVALTCSPTSKPSCSLSPTSVSVPANGTITSTMSLATSGNSTGAGTYTITITGTSGSLVRNVAPSPTWTLN
jgi:hypothetical protein